MNDQHVMVPSLEGAKFQEVEIVISRDLGAHFDEIGFDPQHAGRALQAVASVAGVATKGDLRAQQWLAETFLKTVNAALAGLQHDGTPPPDSPEWKK